MTELSIPNTSNELATTDPGPLSKNPAAVYIAGLRSERSKRTMRSALNTLATLLNMPQKLADPDGPTNGANDLTYLSVHWHELRYQHTSAISARLAQMTSAGDYAPATANKLIAALRGVLKEAWRLGKLNAEDYHRAVDIKLIEGDRLPAGRDLGGGEIMALATACMNDDSAAGVRDAAIIGVLYMTGMRRAELVKLTLADYDRESGGLKIIAGKRNKDRIVYIDGGAKQAVSDWLALRGDDPGALFNPVNKGGNIAQRAMTSQAVYNTLQKRGQQAGVENFSPHDFRRTFIGDMLDADVDAVTITRLTGHSSVELLKRYDRRPERAKQQAVSKLHFPYKRRSMV